MAQPATMPAPGTAPQLTRREEFEAALKDYKINEAGLEILRSTPLTALVGPTGGGRSTVIRELMKTGMYHFIISDTTRPPRQNDGVWEQDGVEYFFRKEDDMLADIQAGMFVEAEVIHSQQVSGISIREVKKAHDEGKIAIVDVEILGGINVAHLKADATVIYLAPPSFEIWLKRLKGRTQTSNDELRNRLQGATKNFRLALEHADRFTFIINREKEETVPIIIKLARTGAHDNSTEHHAQDVVRSLLEQTEAYIRQLAD